MLFVGKVSSVVGCSDGSSPVIDCIGRILAWICSSDWVRERGVHIDATQLATLPSIVWPDSCLAHCGILHTDINRVRFLIVRRDLVLLQFGRACFEGVLTSFPLRWQVCGCSWLLITFVLAQAVLEVFT